MSLKSYEVLRGSPDTVITSFPSKAKSALSMDDTADRRDFMEGDTLYDSTDIWRAVQRELRNKTNYGQRTAKSALDLAWTIADQAQGVFHRRNLHPHLQFIQMFEMEINEIVRQLWVKRIEHTSTDLVDLQSGQGICGIQ